MLSLIIVIVSVSCEKMRWERIGGNLKQIQVDPENQVACGVNDIDDIYCASTSDYKFYNIPGKLKQVTVAKGQIFGVNSEDKIFYSPTIVQGQAALVPIEGSLRQISFDGSTICGADSSNVGKCADENITTKPNWKTVGNGNLKQLVVKGQEVYGLDDLGFANYWSSYKTGSPVLVYNYEMGLKFKQIQYDGKQLCGTTFPSKNNDLNTAYCGDWGLFTSPNYSKLGGKQLTLVSIAGGKYVGVDANSEIFIGRKKKWFEFWLWFS